MDAVTVPPLAVNEPVRTYETGSDERASLCAALKDVAEHTAELTMAIDGHHRLGGGERFNVVAPHNLSTVLGVCAQATTGDVTAAINAALSAAPEWARLDFDSRAAIFLRAADLLTGTWRDTINAATMLGQSKSAHQAEIDAACEFADFLRYNVAYARQIYQLQPVSARGVWNRMDYRPLEGFVLAITPFNFTAIAANLPTAPALMGNVVVWKPSPTQQLAAHHTMALLEAAGLPPGVINMVTGDGQAVAEVAVPHPALAGIHFTGSTATFQALWSAVGNNIATYRTYPRLVGETGGKDFVLAHPSADPDALIAALINGAYEYQRQKCSAASRAYIPRSLWRAGLRDALIAESEKISYGDITDLSKFGGAVIDRRAFTRLNDVLARARAEASTRVLAGGHSDGRNGYFIQPTLIESDDYAHDVFRTEFFGPILAVRVYDDAEWPYVIDQVDSATPYALTGALFANDRTAIADVQHALRFAAGNFYINDKPTGAVVGQQPFGGSRASGTNDKAGSIWNLSRWTSPRAIKEALEPSLTIGHPHML